MKKVPIDQLVSLSDDNSTPLSRRHYLGASQIGKQCSRELFLNWRWCFPPINNSRLERIFELGHILEEQIANIFKDKISGVDLITHEKGKQIGSSFFGGHLQYHIDGLLNTKTSSGLHLWECKSANQTRYKKLLREGYKKFSPEYHSQIMFYCGALKEQTELQISDEILVNVYNKNTSEIYSESIEFEPTIYEKLKDKAQWLLNLKEPPVGAYRASDYQVKNFMSEEERGIYTGKFTPGSVNCRNCRFSKPDIKNTSDKAIWGCLKKKKLLSIKDQQKGCFEHQFIPGLVPGKLINDRDMVYQKGDLIFTNSPASETGDDCFTSSEIAFLSRNNWDIDDTRNLKELRTDLDAEILSVRANE